MNWSHPSVIRLLNFHGSDDPISLIRNLARELVIEGFNSGWIGPPFNPIDLAKKIGISVLPNDEIIDARILPQDGSNYIIEYNSNQRSSRVNFSIAHEIGHALFPDCSERIRNRSSCSDSDEKELEFLCNIAASEILLPYAAFYSEANSVDLSLDSLISLSNKYKASIESVFLRFTEVVEKPCTIAICTFNYEGGLVVDYSKSSINSHLSIKVGYNIPESSKANECLNPGWTSYNIENWDVFNDTKYAIFAIGLSHTKNLRNDRVGILMVPEFYAKNLHSKLYTVYGDATKPRGNDVKIIAQVINTSGAVGFGFGKAMSKSWPESKKAISVWMQDKSSFQLGNSKLTQLESSIFVFQMLCQKGIFTKGDEIPLRYDALQKCLEQLKDCAIGFGASIHMPLIGAGQAGGNWNIIEGMIHEILIRAGIEVTIYTLPGKSDVPKSKMSNLTLFD